MHSALRESFFHYAVAELLKRRHLYTLQAAALEYQGRGVLLGGPCAPAMLLFPHVSDTPYSCLEPLSKSRALEAMMPHVSCLYDREMARREFHTLSRLVQQVDRYRLHFGQDVQDLPN